MSAMDDEAFGGMLSRCRTAACGQQKIASDFVFAGGLQPPSTEGLTRSRLTLPRTYRSCKECHVWGSSAGIVCARCHGEALPSWPIDIFLSA